MQSRLFKGLSLLSLTFGIPAGCGRPAMVLLDAPKEYPTAWRAKRLFHTPNAYIYATTDAVAGETDSWVGDVRTYVTTKLRREWQKGIVLVIEPGDTPLAVTLEQELEFERNPNVMRTPPRRIPNTAEIRAKLADQGAPELPMVRAATLPLDKARLKQIGFDGPAAAWAVAAPSHAYAAECGVPVTAGVLRKRFPAIVKSDEQARALAEKSREKGGKAFELGRGIMLTIVIIQRQYDWSDEQRRSAIREAIRYTYRSNWLPTPKDEDLEW